MRIKCVKKIIYIIPLIIGGLVVYGAISGKTQEKITSIKDKIEVTDKADINEVEKKIEVEMPDGKINLYEWFGEWSEKPLVEVYDPENKIPKNNIYGVTMDERVYIDDLYKEQYKTSISKKMPSEFIGSAIYNKDKIFKWNSKFEIKYNKATYEYSNLDIKDDFVGLDSKFYTEYKYKLIEKLDKNGKLTGASMLDFNTNEKIENVECKLVMFDVTITPHSEWVAERIAVPELLFLKEEGNALKRSYKYYCSYGELDIVDCYPIYYDLGLYDIDTIGSNDIIYYCPMRKGEVIKFKVGYIIPVELMDEAYFVYNSDHFTSTDYSYSTEDIAIFKVSEGK